MKKSLTVCCLVLLAACSKEEDNTAAMVALALIAAPRPSPVPMNVAAVSNTKQTATLTWDEVSGAIVYNVYYTVSPSTPSVDASGAFTVIQSAPDPSVVAASTSTVTQIKNVTSPLSITGLRYGIPHKFIVTAVTGAGEGLPSAAADLAEVYPTQAQRLRGIWIVGGLSAGYAGPLAAVDFYDPDTATWFPSITTLPTPVSFAGIGSERKKIIVVGGFTTSGATSGLTQVFDILSHAWTNRTAGPASSRANQGTASYAGKIYFLGGTTVGATTAWAGSNAQDIYDVANDTWTVGVAYGAAGSGRAPVSIGGVVYNNGGRTAAATMAATHDGVIIPQNALTTGNTEVLLTSARTGHSVVAYQNGLVNEMWTIGGATALTGVTTAGVAAGAITTYTPSLLVQSLANPFSAGATWQALPPQLPNAAGFGSAVVDPRNGNVYFTGGNSNSVTPALPTGNTTFIRTNFVTKEPWSALAVMPNGRWGHKAVIPN